MADTNDYRVDGFFNDNLASAISNLNTGAGSSRDKLQNVEVNVAPKILSWEERTGLYRSSKIVEKIVDLPAEAAAKHWGTWSFSSDAGEDTSDLVKAMDDYCSKLDLIDSFTNAAKCGRLDGDGFIVIDIQDGNDISQPVDKNKIKSIGFLEVLERDELQPDTSRSIRNPMQYRFNISQDTSDNFKSLNVRIIHADRVLRFPGKKLPDRGLRYNGGYNDSAIQACFNELSAYLQSNYAASGMLADYSIFKYALKGLGRLAAQGNTSTLTNRFIAIQMGLSNFKGLMVDADDESAEFINRNFGGIEPILHRMEDFLLTATGFPRSKLFGYSGQNALSEGGKTDERLWAEYVINYQSAVWGKPRRKMGEYILLAKDGPTNGDLVKGFDFTWESALQLTAKEQAELEKLYAETDKINIESKVLHPLESRGRQSGYRFNAQLTLRDDYTDQLESAFDVELEDTEIEDTEDELEAAEDSPRADWEDAFRADAKLSELKRNSAGKVWYLNQWWTPNKPVPSTKKDKKKMVLAVKDGNVKLVHFGQKGYSDFTKHGSEKRKANFKARFAGIKDKSGNSVVKDRHSAAYWASKVLW